VLVALAVLLAAAPAGMALSDKAPGRGPAPGPALGDIAHRAGCELTEFDGDPHSNPPVSGRVDERVRAADGSYVGRRPPAAAAAVHALLHGRVIFQYRPELSRGEVTALGRLVRQHPRNVLLFANETAMPAPVAATAYLAMMTCPRVDAGTLGALRAFHARRVDFGQRF
jgi:Protein of unknown function (DUF3105)